MKFVFESFGAEASENGTNGCHATNGESQPTLSSLMRLRYILLHQIALSTYFIQYLQSWRCFLVDSYFILLSLLGDTFSYTIIFPLLTWTISPQFGRIFTLTLIFDFGVPSTHSMNSLVMSWFAIYWFWPKLSYSGAMISICLSTAYILNMILSRMYLAAHSHIDVIFGTLFGIVFFFVWINLYQLIDDFIVTCPYSPLVTFVAFCAFIFFHPRSSRPSPSLRNSIRLLGLAFGINIGVRQIFSQSVHLVPHKNSIIIDFINFAFVTRTSGYVRIFTCFLLGQTILFIGYLICKNLSFLIFNLLLNLPGLKDLVRLIKKYSTFVAIPHPFALDNADHPQWNLDTQDRLIKSDSKILGNVVGACWIGYALTYFVPIVLINLGLIEQSLLSS